ncbi:MAG: hypothetical protein EBS05_23540 [Proteobacteria bacterium]|nr:hypothetical protein [Pseudomonadota bacterium]
MKPSNQELDALLHSAQVPERPAKYWEEFPAAVMGKLPPRGVSGAPARADHTPEIPRRLWAWGLGLATACLLLGFFAGFRRGHAAGFSAAEVAQGRKIYHELDALFPGRLQTVQLGGQGSQLSLDTEARPPASAPLLVQICHAGECRRFITFSGQRVVFDGDVFEVFADAAGNVLVVGKRFAWTSGAPGQAANGYRIRATTLGEML